jgi:PilZ domain
MASYPGLERRTAPRYPIEADLEYSLCDTPMTRVRAGRAVNMSTSGLLFLSPDPLSVGTRIEIRVAWPALAGPFTLYLWVSGRVARGDSASVAIEIGQHQFRLRRSAGRAVVL